MLDVFLSFLEGLALIASPCILPVLPLVLAASVDGDKGRPFGIILGFIASFTAFALLSRKLVMVAGIDAEILKTLSLIMLFAFGATMVSDLLSNKFSAITQKFSNFGNHLAARQQGGFISGIIIGTLIGLVWTPCAGPILAAVLVQVIRQESDISAFFLVASFALGAGTPMLVISIAGQKIMAKLHFFIKHAQAGRRFLGMIIMLAVVVIAAGASSSSFLEFGNRSSRDEAQNSGLVDALDRPYPAPEIAGIESWLNTQPMTLKSLKGKVVLIDFWTYSCINCVRTLPYVTAWDRKYRNHGLVIIGIHSPEFEFEKKKENVVAAIKKNKIEYAVALDNQFDTWVAFKNRYWPAHYLIDKEGNVVYTHFGEGNYQETENNIRYLLGLDQQTSPEIEKKAFSNDQSPETYLGNARAVNFSSPQKIKLGSPQEYTIPKNIPLHGWALSGAWTFHSQHISAQEPGASLQYHFEAGKVFLVLGSTNGNAIDVQIKLNGKPYRKIRVQDQTLYELVNQEHQQTGIVEIISEAGGLEAYAFTFGI